MDINRSKENIFNTSANNNNNNNKQFMVNSINKTFDNNISNSDNSKRLVNDKKIDFPQNGDGLKSLSFDGKPNDPSTKTSIITPSSNNSVTFGGINLSNSEDSETASAETKPLTKSLSDNLCDDKNKSASNNLNNIKINKNIYNDYVNPIKLVSNDDEIRPLLQSSNSGGCDVGNPSLTNITIEKEIPKTPSKSNQPNKSINNEQKHLKSIVKSSSSQNFFSDQQNSTNNRPRLSLQCPDGTITENRHVQFLQNLENSTSKLNSTINEECNSPLGSIISNSSQGNQNTSSSSSSSSSSDDENSSIGQFSEARPPDGGWGWVVVFASFMVNLIADGVTFSFGVIYIEFLNYFGEGKAKTAWIGSLFMAMPLLSGPIASFLTDRYGCRKVTVAGSILASIGFVISSFADSMEMLFFTFGILAGFGLSLCYVAAVVIVAYYFDKKRSFATGLSVCGSGIGTFIFAPLTQILIDEYGWRGTTLILAGIFLNMTVCGMLMRDLEWTTYRAKLKAKEKKKMCVSADSFSISNSTNTGTTNGANTNTGDDDVFEGRKSSDEKDLDLDDPRLFCSLVNLPTYIKNGEKVPSEVLELLATHRNVRNVIFQNYPSLLHSRSFSEPFTNSNNGISQDASQQQNTTATISSNSPNSFNVHDQEIPTEEEFIHWLRRNSSHHHHRHHSEGPRPTSAYLKDLRVHRHSLTYRGAMLNINRYRLRASSCPDIYRNSMTTIAKEKTQWYQGIGEFKSLFVDILDFSYFTDIRFLLFTVSNFLLYTWYDVPYVYLADYATEMGYSDSEASKLISFIGIINMIGEILLGWIGDKKYVSANFVYAVCMFFCGAVIALVPLFKSYEVLSVISGSFGFFIAANYSLTSIILVELITLEKFTNAYGLLLLMQGIANLIGPPLAGWITDITGHYDLSFYIAGFFVVISGVILLIVPAIGKYKKYKALKRSDSNGNNNNTKESGNNFTDTTQPNGKVNNGNAIISDCFEKDLLKDSMKVNHV